MLSSVFTFDFTFGQLVNPPGGMRCGLPEKLYGLLVSHSGKG